MFYYVLKGGVIMVFLIICSITSLAVIIERIVMFRRCRINEEEFIKNIQTYISRGEINRAISLCDEVNIPFVNVMKSVLLAKAKGDKKLEDALEDSSLEEIPKLERYLPILSTIASVSTLLGFTGTVLGMINAFNSIAQAGTSSPSIVASGIAQALVTTATGLLIAIPTIIFYHYFSNRVDKIARIVNLKGKELIEFLK